MTCAVACGRHVELPSCMFLTLCALDASGSSAFFYVFRFLMVCIDGVSPVDDNLQVLARKIREKVPRQNIAILAFLLWRPSKGHVLEAGQVRRARVVGVASRSSRKSMDRWPSHIRRAGALLVHLRHRSRTCVPLLAADITNEPPAGSARLRTPSAPF